MKTKPFGNTRSLLRFIFAFGIILDTQQIYSFWKELHDTEKFNQLFLSQGIPTSQIDLEGLLLQMQQILSPALVAFLIIDYMAYFFLLRHKEWARKYILSISLFYLLGCFFSFSLAQGLFGLVCFYYLWGQKESFSELRNQNT
ncbi:hypothetical protein GW915_08615 [bacterium]|nr:hypothetical protein [bacterium]